MAKCLVLNSQVWILPLPFISPVTLSCSASHYMAVLECILTLVTRHVNCLQLLAILTGQEEMWVGRSDADHGCTDQAICLWNGCHLPGRPGHSVPAFSQVRCQPSSRSRRSQQPSHKLSDAQISPSQFLLLVTKTLYRYARCHSLLIPLHTHKWRATHPTDLHKIGSVPGSSQ